MKTVDAAQRETLARVDAYYSEKIARFGATPRGVDWTCLATQQLRFVQLARVCAASGDCSLNDLGCGYGALLEFVRERWPERRIVYTGIDLSAAMVEAARRRFAPDPNVRFLHATAFPAPADYGFASGVFNVRQAVARADWEEFVRATLRELGRTSRIAFAVNFMAPLAPDTAGPAELYRTAPGPWVEFCERELGGDIEVVERYGLREFSLLVRLRRS